jgi:hypothetical protein
MGVKSKSVMHKTVCTATKTIKGASTVFRMAVAAFLTARCFLFFFSKQLYPLPVRKKKRKSKTNIKAEEKSASKSQSNAKSGALDRFRELRSLIASILIRMPRTFSLKIKRLFVSVATRDPSKTALLYGTVCSTLAFTLEWIDRHLFSLRHDRRDAITVLADFEGESIELDAHLSLSTSLYRLLTIGVSVILPHFLRHRRKRKIKSALQKKEATYVRSQKQTQRAD